MFFKFFEFFCYFSGIPYSRSGWNGSEREFFFLTFSASLIPFCFEKKPQWCFLIFLIFLLFFWNSLFRVGLEWIETIIFFPLILSLSHPVLAWKEVVMMIFKFLNFFAIFLEFPIPGRVGMDQNEKFFSHILSLSRPVLVWKEAILMFFSFLNFFAIFLEFPSPGQVGMD